MRGHTNIVASHAVCLKDGKILMARRANTGYEDGNYGLPAGHVEAGENFTDACVREITEEVGIVVTRENCEIGHIVQLYFDDHERIGAFFVIREWEGEPENTEPDKCDDVAWFDLNDLPENTIPYIRHSLENIRKGIMYSEYGWERN